MLTLTPEQLAIVLKTFGAKCYASVPVASSYRLWLPPSNIDAYFSWLKMSDKNNNQCCCDVSVCTPLYYIFHNHICHINTSKDHRHEDGVIFTCYYHQDIIYKALQLIT